MLLLGNPLAPFLLLHDYGKYDREVTEVLKISFAGVTVLTVGFDGTRAQSTGRHLDRRRPPLPGWRGVHHLSGGRRPPGPDVWMFDNG